jgi:hypothetical protein
MNFFDQENEDEGKDRRPRVPEDLFDEVQEDEDKPFHENLADKLDVDEDDGDGLL